MGRGLLNLLALLCGYGGMRDFDCISAVDEKEEL
jgi:hypothetical protein